MHTRLSAFFQHKRYPLDLKAVCSYSVKSFEPGGLSPSKQRG